jgi:hypothetical protein
VKALNFRQKVSALKLKITAANWHPALYSGISREEISADVQ